MIRRHSSGPSWAQFTRRTFMPARSILVIQGPSASAAEGAVTIT